MVAGVTPTFSNQLNCNAVQNQDSVFIALTLVADFKWQASTSNMNGFGQKN
jgi:hypothetical protein